MSEYEINPYIIITNIDSDEKLKIMEKYVTIRKNNDKMMAVSYKAPIFEIIEFEKYFDNMNSSQKLKFNIGGTGSIGVHFRGMIDGKQKNYDQNVDHKIVFLEEYKCPKKEDYQFIKPTSKFVGKVRNQKKN